MKPIARRSEVLEQPVGDELVLYDQRAHRAHRLNPVAGVLWRRSDGSRSIEALAACLHDELGLPADDTGPVIHGLDELARADLLTAAPRLRHRLFDRRAALLAAATLVPMVTTIVVPTPAHAQSVGFPPPPTPDFEKFNGAFEGRAVLIDAGGFLGFSNQVHTFADNAVDDQGEGTLDVTGVPKTEYDLGQRAYAVTIQSDGSISGGGSSVTAQGVDIDCTISGSFNATCTRLQFTEIVNFDNHIGTATWEVTVRR